jgi:hypothetical protein
MFRQKHSQILFVLCKRRVSPLRYLLCVCMLILQRQKQTEVPQDPGLSHGAACMASANCIRAPHVRTSNRCRYLWSKKWKSHTYHPTVGISHWQTSILKMSAHRRASFLYRNDTRTAVSPVVESDASDCLHRPSVASVSLQNILLRALTDKSLVGR